MFIEQSFFRETTRIRVMEQVNVDGTWKRKLVRHIGTARDELEKELLVTRAREFVDTQRHPGQLFLKFLDGDTRRSQIKATGEYWEGAELVLGTLFDNFSFEIRAGDRRLLRNLVIARIMNPVSKRRTAAWLSRALHCSYSDDEIYRFMDRLYKKRSSVNKGIQQYIARKYPLSLNYLLYDVTTMYWETDDEDLDVAAAAGLRKMGYSKDHREDLPQVVVGLAVNTLGMPLDCQVYTGSEYEGKTFLNGVTSVLHAMQLDEMTVVADAGMLSNENLNALDTIKDARVRYIVGARLKNLPRVIQQCIVAHNYAEQPVWEFEKDGRRYVVSYSAKRARKAQHAREQSVARLKELIARNKAIRKHKFLDVTIADHPRLNQKAIEEAAQWDGIKGYVTNNRDMTADEVIARYSELYHVEQSFRMSKTDLRIRPAYHHLRERIEAHILICMVSLCLMRILEESVKPLGLTLGEGIRTLEQAKGAVLDLKGKSYTVPPLYSQTMESIVDLLIAQKGA